VTREARPAEELIRFVRAPDGTVVADLKRRLPGRGVWLSPDRATIAEAVKRKVFARGFKQDVSVPGDLPDAVGALFERAALDMLSLANKAGRVVAGFGKVETALQGGKAAAVLHAKDGAEDGKRKLAQAARRAGAEVPVLGIFTSGQMDLALGRENVIHAALLADPVSDAFLARAGELMRYRQDETGRSRELAAETDQE
jgi:predicted RNA-binding protein YlxR (DUF448 family)